MEERGRGVPLFFCLEGKGLLKAINIVSKNLFMLLNPFTFIDFFGDEFVVISKSSKESEEPRLNLGKARINHEASLAFKVDNVHHVNASVLVAKNTNSTLESIRPITRTKTTTRMGLTGNDE